MRTRIDCRIPITISTIAAVMLATAALGQVMPLPVGPPLARTDGPSYGPPYPPPQSVALAKTQPVPTVQAIAKTETPKEPPVAATTPPKASKPAEKPRADPRHIANRDGRPPIARPVPPTRTAMPAVRTTAHAPDRGDLRRQPQSIRR